MRVTAEARPSPALSAGIADEARLADACLAFHHERARGTARRPLQSPREELLLLRPAGEPRIVLYRRPHGASIVLAGPEVAETVR